MYSIYIYSISLCKFTDQCTVSGSWHVTNKKNWSTTIKLNIFYNKMKWFLLLKYCFAKSITVNWRKPWSKSECNPYKMVRNPAITGYSALRPSSTPVLYMYQGWSSPIFLYMYVPPLNVHQYHFLKNTHTVRFDMDL